MHEELLAARPSPIDRVVVLPPIRGVSVNDRQHTEPADAEACLLRLRAERFDLALQLHGGGGYSNPFVRALGARLTVGLRAPGAEPLDLWTPYFYYQPEVVRYLEVLTLLGIRPSGLEPRFEVVERDRQEACAVLSQLTKPFAVLHPGATDERRRWPAERFAAVGDRLAAAGAAVVVTGTGTERALVEQVVETMAQPAVDACDALSINGLVGLLSEAALVVSNDTGPLHLAAALGAATAGIFWCGNMVNGAPMTRTRHRPFPAWQSSCPICGRHISEARCEHDPSFVTEVSTDAVAQAAVELLERAQE